MCLSLVRVLGVLGLQWKSLQRLLFLPSQDVYLGNSSPWTESVDKMSTGLVQQLGELLGPEAKENCSPKYRRVLSQKVANMEDWEGEAAQYRASFHWLRPPRAKAAKAEHVPLLPSEGQPCAGRHLCSWALSLSLKDWDTQINTCLLYFHACNRWHSCMWHSWAS